MELHEGFSALRPIAGAVVTIGTFDGVHLGHRSILQRIRSLAKERNGESVLVTFEPHPRMVLFPDDHGLKLLSTPEEKRARLQAEGLDHLVVLPFTHAFSRVTGMEFVRDVLVNGLGAKLLVIGYDHHFGRNREGSFEQLRAYGPSYGFEVEEIPAQDVDAVAVSSSKIRAALEAGAVDKARNLLGYYYGFSGTVVHGKALGRTLGFPTANLQVGNANKLIPASGVYAVKAFLRKMELNGVMHIGKPGETQAPGEVKPEVHLFDFSDSCYGETLRIECIARLREDRHYNAIEALVTQMHADAKQAKALLGMEV